MIPCHLLKMLIELNRTKISLPFPFSAVVTLMLLLCNNEIVLISLFSSLFHELGHLFFMLLFREAPSLIVFGAFGIRIERRNRGYLSYKKEALIALGGIFGNLIIVITALPFAFFLKSSWAMKIISVNLLIALFNMLPVRVLDFGKCLECILSFRLSSEKGERILSALSLITAVSIMIFSLLYNVFIGINVSFIAVSIYIILVTTLKE